MEKGYQYRINLKASQEKQLNTMFAAKRFVWNHFLRLNMDRFEQKQRIMTYPEMSSCLTALKKEQGWLFECEKSVLQNTLRDLASAYSRFFSGSMQYSKRTLEKAHRTGRSLTFYDLEGHPKFKSCRDMHQSCRMNFTNNNIEVLEKETQYTSTGKYKKQNCKIKLPKLKRVKAAYSRQIQGRILSATLSRSPDNKYYISLCCTDVPDSPGTESEEVIGIDLGLQVFAVTSTGETIENPKHYSKYESRLKKEQHKLSRRKIGGKNRQRQRLKVSRLHQRIKNLRTDFINNQTTRLLRHNKIICVEDLKSANMLKNHRLAKSIADASWYEFKRQLLYKARWQNKIVVVIDPFYPSSQICSSCGFKNEKLKDLKIRS